MQEKIYFPMSETLFSCCTMKKNTKKIILPLGYFPFRSPLIVETRKNGTKTTT